MNIPRIHHIPEQSLTHSTRKTVSYPPEGARHFVLGNIFLIWISIASTTNLCRTTWPSKHPRHKTLKGNATRRCSSTSSTTLSSPPPPSASATMRPCPLVCTRAHACARVLTEWSLLTIASVVAMPSLLLYRVAHVPYMSFAGGRVLGAIYLFFAVNEFMNTLTQLAELPNSLRTAKDEENVRGSGD